MIELIKELEEIKQKLDKALTVARSIPSQLEPGTDDLMDRARKAATNQSIPMNSRAFISGVIGFYDAKGYLSVTQEKLLKSTLSSFSL